MEKMYIISESRLRELLEAEIEVEEAGEYCSNGICFREIDYSGVDLSKFKKLEEYEAKE